MNRELARVLASPLSKAFHFIDRRLRRLPRTNVSRLVDRSTWLFTLSPAEAEWLLWTLVPNRLALAPKEPSP
jgi:hypothetical protein